MTRSTNPQPGPYLLRGSLITLRRKCGKPNCRCAKGAPHETPALSYSVGGTTRMLTLRRQDTREVRAALRRYQKVLKDLERQSLTAVRELRRRIQKEKRAQQHDGQNR